MRKVVLDTNVLVSGIIACALEGDVDCVVSGDPHLLELRQWGGIPILTPRQFALMLPGGKPKASP